MIAMTRLRTLALLGLFFTAVLLLSTVHYVSANDSEYILSQTDTRDPDIWAWGIEGVPELGNGFDTWANVTDDESGVRNVTIHVIGPNMTFNNLMAFNGSFYTVSVPVFPNSGTFNVYIRAFDMDNNTRTSYNVNIVYDSNPVPPVDPSVTMPVVVVSSIGLMVVVVGIAMFYDRKRGPGERVMQPEYGG